MQDFAGIGQVLAGKYRVEYALGQGGMGKVVVARVIEVGTLESGAPYIAMELLQGSSLHALVATEGALPIDQVLDYVLEACDAVAEAHALGIVHRDLKAENLFL